MLGTIGKHNNLHINTLEKHVVPNGTSESTSGTTDKAQYNDSQRIIRQKSTLWNTTDLLSIHFKISIPRFGA